MYRAFNSDYDSWVLRPDIIANHIVERLLILCIAFVELHEHEGHNTADPWISWAHMASKGPLGLEAHMGALDQSARFAQPKQIHTCAFSNSSTASNICIQIDTEVSGDSDRTQIWGPKC
jgi:hypothetical protein